MVTNNFKCKICHRAFTTKVSLNKHFEHHSKVKPASHSCKYCGQMFNKLSHLKVHLSKHTGRKAHKCKVCGKTFTQSGSLTMHNRIHTGEKPYPCPFCSSKFRRSDVLQKHIIRIHQHEKAFKCGKCFKSFYTPSQVRYHQNVEHVEHGEKVKVNRQTSITNQKHHQCNVCFKAFSHLFNLRNHQTSHARNFPFTCQVCGDMFSSLGHLENHQETDHLSFPCQFCGRDFKEKYLLQNHLASEEDNNVYECEFCNMVCTCVSDLLMHLKSLHTGDKPYFCNICTLTFSKSEQLQVHMDIHKETKDISEEIEIEIEDAESSDSENENITISGDIKTENTEDNKGNGGLETPHGGIKCKICGKLFTSAKAFFGHKKIHNAPEAIECKICRKVFLSQSAYSGHKKCHKNMLDKRKQPPVKKVSQKKVVLKKPSFKEYKCHTCGKTFSTCSGLNGHTRHHKAQSFTLSSKLFAKKAINYKPLNGMRHKCKICGEGYHSAAALYGHYKMHKGKSFVVKQEKIEADQDIKPECTMNRTSNNSGGTGKTSTNPKSNTSPGVRRYLCAVCYEVFYSHSELNAHYKSHPNFDRSRSDCPTCGKKFRSHGVLLRHTLTHSGERPFKCDYCDHRFKRTDNLKTHMKLMHNVT